MEEKKTNLILVDGERSYGNLKKRSQKKEYIPVGT
jgi:hypothetical protein